MGTAIDLFRRRLLFGAAALASGAVLPRRVASADQASTNRPIEIGILPYMPTATLIAGHQGLRRHFEETFKRSVALSTAPDFRSFQHRVLAGDFDLTIIGPGPGWQAHLDRGHQVVAVSKRMVRIYILVAKGSPIKNFADLRGTTLATIDPLTVTSQTTMAVLRDNKLQPGADIQVRHEKTPFNAAQALALGEVAAAGFPNIAYPNLPADIRAKLRILVETDGMPGVLFMARPTPDVPAPEEFQAALFRFVETAEGKAYVKEFNHDGLIRPDPNVLRALDRFVPETRRLMAGP
jgi:phosphonate transport system substrate-binding protein